MNIIVDVSSESRVPINRKRIRKTVHKLISGYRIKGPLQIDIRVVGSRKMRQLSKDYRNKNDIVSVLSFALEDPHPACQNLRIIEAEADEASIAKKRVTFVAIPDGVLWLGSVVICFPKARSLAADENVMVDEEIDRLVKHGVRNLLGISE